MRNEGKKHYVLKKRLIVSLVLILSFLCSMNKQVAGKEVDESQKENKEEIVGTNKIKLPPTIRQSKELPSNRSLYMPSPPPGCKIPLDSEKYFAVPNGYVTGTREGGKVMVFTSEPYQSGTLWAKSKLNLAKDFNFKAHIYLGDDGKNAQDGITFTMHNDKRGTKAISYRYGYYDVIDQRGRHLGVYGGFGGMVTSNGGGANVGYNNWVDDAICIEFDTYLDSGFGSLDPGAFDHQDEAIGKMAGGGRRGNHNGHIAQVFTSQFNSDCINYDNPNPHPSAPLYPEENFGREHHAPQIAPSTMANGQWKEIKIEWKAATRTLSTTYSDKTWTTKQSVSYTPAELRRFWPDWNREGVYWGFSGATSQTPTINAIGIETMPGETEPEPEPEPEKNGVTHTAKIKNITQSSAEGTSVEGKANDTVQLKSTTKLKTGFTSQNIGSITATLDQYLEYERSTAKLNGMPISDNQLTISGNTVKISGASLNLTSSKRENNFTINAKVKSNVPNSTTLQSRFTANGGDLTGDLATEYVDVTIGKKETPPENSDFNIRVKNSPLDIWEENIRSPRNSKPYIKMKARPISGTYWSTLTFVMQLEPGVKYVANSARDENGKKIPASKINYNSSGKLAISGLHSQSEIELQVEFDDKADIDKPIPFYYWAEGTTLPTHPTSGKAYITLDPLPQVAPILLHDESVTNGSNTGLSVQAKPNDTVTFKDKLYVGNTTSWQNGKLEILTDNRLDYQLNTLAIDDIVVDPQNITSESGKIILNTFPNVSLINQANVQISAKVKSDTKRGDICQTTFVAKDGNLVQPNSSRTLEVNVNKLGKHVLLHVDNETFQPIPGQDNIDLEGEVGSTYTITPTTIKGYEYVSILPPNLNITFTDQQSTSTLVYKKKEKKFIVPEIDFGTIESTTSGKIDNYPTKNIKITLDDSAMGAWTLFLKMKENFKTPTGSPLHGNFYFKNGATPKAIVTTNNQQVYDSTSGTGISSTDREIIWDKAQGQGMSFMNEPGNLTMQYEGIFQWSLVDGL